MTVASLLVPQEDEDKAEEVTPSKDQELAGQAAAAQVKQDPRFEQPKIRTQREKKLWHKLKVSLSFIWRQLILFTG